MPEFWTSCVLKTVQRITLEGKRVINIFDFWFLDHFSQKYSNFINKLSLSHNRDRKKNLPIIRANRKAVFLKEEWKKEISHHCKTQLCVGENCLKLHFNMHTNCTIQTSAWTKWHILLFMLLIILWYCSQLCKSAYINWEKAHIKCLY